MAWSAVSHLHTAYQREKCTHVKNAFLRCLRKLLGACSSSDSFLFSSGSKYAVNPFVFLVPRACRLFSLRRGDYVLQIFSMLGVPLPAWHAKVQENKMLAVVSLFMINSVAHNMLATGAFEVEYNGNEITCSHSCQASIKLLQMLCAGQLVFSKLDAKRMPSFEEIVAGLRRAGFRP